MVLAALCTQEGERADDYFPALLRDGDGHGHGHGDRGQAVESRRSRRTIDWASVSLRLHALMRKRSCDASTMPSDPRDKWTIFHFSESNPDGRGQGDVPALLRRVADSIDALGEVVVEDITFNSEPTAEERDLTITVYYHRDRGS